MNSIKNAFSVKALRHLSIEHLWPLAVLVGIFVFVNTHPIRPHDFWWHAAVGREIVTTGQIPQIDTYSFTAPGAPYLSYQSFWLMEAALYFLLKTGGPAWVVLAQSIMITTAYALVCWLSYQASRNWRIAAFCTLLAAALGINDWNVRPQAVTFMFAPLFMIAINAYQATRRRVWLLVFPLGMVIWVNSHGTFPLGLFLIGVWLLEEAWQTLKQHAGTGTRIKLEALGAPFTALVAASLACLLNPRGLDMVNYLTAMSANTIIQNLTPEWSPPTFDTVKGILFFAALLGTAAVLAISPKRPSVREMLSFLGIAALGLKTFRGAIWYGLIVAPILARHLPSIIREANRSLFPRRRSEPRPILATPRETVLNVTFAGLLLLGGFSSLPWFKSVWPLPPEKAGLLSNETPVAAVAYMAEAELPPQVFHAMPFGSYLAWAAQPEYPVFVDSRIELYPPEVWFDYLAISAAAEGWEAKLSAYGIHTLMLSQQLQPALVQAAAASSEWTEVYQDATCVVFVRSE